jgi:hypothetical protein
MPDDYIMRLIRQISAALAGIIAKQKGGNLVEAREELATTCVLTIGVTLAQIKQLSPEAVAELLNKTGASRHLRAVTLAELLLLDAEVNPTAGEPSPPSANQVHAFCLLADSMSALNREEQATYRPKLDRLADQLGELRTHPYIKERIRDFGTAGKKLES